MDDIDYSLRRLNTVDADATILFDDGQRLTGAGVWHAHTNRGVIFDASAKVVRTFYREDVTGIRFKGAGSRRVLRPEAVRLMTKNATPGWFRNAARWHRAFDGAVKGVKGRCLRPEPVGVGVGVPQPQPPQGPPQIVWRPRLIDATGALRASYAALAGAA